MGLNFFMILISKENFTSILTPMIGKHPSVPHELDRLSKYAVCSWVKILCRMYALSLNYFLQSIMLSPYYNGLRVIWG